MAEGQFIDRQNMAPLSSLDDYDVADDSVDIRGWKVRATSGTEIGEVDDLIVDPASMQARYLVVSLNGASRGTAGAERRMDGESSDSVLVPVSRVQIDDNERRVELDSSGAGLEQLPRYHGKEVDRDYNETFGRLEQQSHDSGAQRLTRSAEELRIGKRTVDAGEVKVRKHVETERVTTPVTRTREDVHIERRPVADGQHASGDLGEGEIRIPITEEEIVVEKRPVVKEEVVVTRTQATETENIETDLRKERIDVERTKGTGRHEDEFNDSNRRSGRS